MTRVPSPDPEVYRRAARKVEKEGIHSCPAILDSTPDYATGRYYLSQYTKMFGPYEGDICVGQGRLGDFHYVRGFDIKLRNKHPYWDRTTALLEAQQCRVIALLLMADIVEQGCCL